MHTRWFQDCKTVEERSERIKLVRSSPELVKVINNMLKRHLADLERTKVSPLDYGEAAWAYKQADLNGCIRIVSEYLQILDQEEINK